MKIGILLERFITDQSDKIVIGGVQVWIGELIKILKGLGHELIVVQKSPTEFHKVLDDVEVFALRFNPRPGGEYTYNIRAHKVMDQQGVERIVYGNSLITSPIYRPGQIFLQHGIYWDGNLETHLRSFLKKDIMKRFQARHDLKLYKKSKLTIAVDTNFVNYARATLRQKFEPEKIVYIPNFAVLPDNEDWKKKWDNPEEIVFLFPRRFAHYRGTLLWAKVVQNLLATTQNTRFIFDGEGRYESHLRSCFENNPRVKIRPVSPCDMPAEYAAAHVVAVPTIFSEGTSLGCLEGMANGCVPLVTDVGGLANLVLPDYNGLMVRPLASELLKASEYILADIPRAKELALAAERTARLSFGINKWRDRVSNAIVASEVLS